MNSLQVPINKSQSKQTMRHSLITTYSLYQASACLRIFELSLFFFCVDFYQDAGMHNIVNRSDFISHHDQAVVNQIDYTFTHLYIYTSFHRKNQKLEQDSIKIFCSFLYSGCMNTSRYKLAQAHSVFWCFLSGLLLSQSAVHMLSVMHQTNASVNWH